MSQQQAIAPGARVVIRDAEWLIRRVDRNSNGGQALTAVGLSEVVKDKETIFLTEIEDDIKILDPVETELVTDTSNYYRDSLLYLESLLRQTPPTDEHIYLGHRAAIDLVPYQLDPAVQALQQPRQRILIADAVGLGKTIEVGILLSELIKRCKAKRILVLAVKSMLTQFQKELWSRFAIPLTRLDSVGIQRVRTRIPTNHNPFYYYDKAIISIDTLKQDSEYRTYLENCYWDVIVIDEAHNVAERGTLSMRSRLARLLASRSDTLVMLTATPHDGRARSFASLMNMLNPTAIADPDHYGPEDIKGLFIRRFKKDIIDQVAASFRQRRIAVKHSSAGAAEEAAYALLTGIRFTRLDQRRTAGKLFKTTLEKSLFSSPAACLQTIRNRVRRLENEQPREFAEDIRRLKELAEALQKITPADFSKYQNLLKVIRDPQTGFGWDGRDTTDRLVIFTERIETLKFLQENLLKDLKLKEAQVAILRGDMPDTEQQAVVENFGQEESPVRLLIATDVASEGINLHFLCHKMIHFDIPWSLMVFQQRNGRIDRYGQERDPSIIYLVTDSDNPKIQGDTRILELLIRKDEQATRNIGDPSALMGVYDIDEEEKQTAEAMESGKSEAEFETELDNAPPDPLTILMGGEAPPAGEAAEQALKQMPSLFPDDYHYLKEAIAHLRNSATLQADFDDARQTIHFTAPEELRQRFKFYPREIWPENGEFILSADPERMKAEIKRSRKDEQTWPRIHLLWELHPLLQWVNDKVLASFGRQQAPLITLPGALDTGEAIFILSGLVPNRKSHPLIHHWFGVRFRNGTFAGIMAFSEVLKRSRLRDQKFPNRQEPFDGRELKALLPEAVEKAREWMHQRREEFRQQMKPRLMAQLQELDRLRQKKMDELEKRFGPDAQLGQLELGRKNQQRREIERIFEEYVDWVTDTLETEDSPYLRVVAVLRG